jgi:serine/threonine protein kinase
MAQAAAAARGSGSGAKPRPQGSKPQAQAKAPASKAGPSSPPKPAAPLSALDALAAAARAAKGEPELPEAEPVDEEPVAQVEPEPEKPAAAAPAGAPEPVPAKAQEAAPEKPVVVVPEKSPEPAPAKSAEPARAAPAEAAPAKPPEPAPASRRGPDPTATPFRTTGHVAREEKADALVGTRINGFKIQSRIGTGGFGVVYRAFDTNLERSVAIKMLPPRIAKAGQGILDRFLREARSAAKLAHPNIVTIHQICPYKDTYYIVMELVDGGALHEYLAAQKRFAPAEATRIIRAAAEGLGHAHRRGIIHRDVKPGNIMMTHDGQVKVSDFGLARDVLQGHDIVGAGHSLGTPRYMAPEQARGEEPTGSSDLYSLAATFYALLTGRAPFDAPNEREIMIKQVQEPVPDPRQFVPDLPIAAFRFFEKAMAKDPNDRYMTADDFVAALDRLDFSQRDASAPMAQALASQIGAISAEDRGSHLTETLGRAVRMAQRQRTPPPGHVVETLAAPTAKGKAGWKIGLLIGIIVVVVIAAAIVAAIMLSKNRTTEGPLESPTTSAKAPTPGETPTPPAPTPGETPTTPSTKPGETPTTPATKPGEKTTPPIATSSSSPQESNAQSVLKEAQEYEKQPGTPPEDAIRVYEENVIKVYPKTKAAVEAQKAVDRLRGGKQDETPPAKTDTPPEKPAEKAPEKPAVK